MKFDLRIIHIPIIVVAVFLCYFNAIGNGFVWDDHGIVAKESLSRGLAGMGDVILSEDTYDSVHTGYYRPVTYLFFLAQRAVWGLNPLGFKIVSLSLHVCVAILLYFVLWRMLGDDKPAFVAALLFVLHPVNSETVNFISGGSNTLLCALFMLAALFFYLSGRYLLAMAAFGLSLASKEFSLLLPLVLFAYERLLCEKRILLKSYMPFFIVIALYVAVKSLVVGGIQGFAITELPGRLLMVPQIFVTYLQTLLFPWLIRVPYYIPPYESIGARFILYLSLLVVAAYALYRLRYRRAEIFFVLWLAVFFLPVTNIIDLGVAPMADRYAYFSAMGFAAIMALLLMRIPPKARYAVVVVLCMGYGAIVVNRNPVWKDDISLYSAMISGAPQYDLGYSNLSRAYYRGFELQKTVAVLEKAESMGIDNMDMLLLLCGAYLELDMFDKAEETLKKALALKPKDMRANLMLGSLYMMQGNEALANEYLNKDEDLRHLMDTAMRDEAARIIVMAEEEQAAGETDKSAILYKRALILSQKSARALLGLGSILAEKGEIDKAIDLFERAAVYEPLNPIPHYNLSLAYELKGMSDKAKAEDDIYRKLLSDSGKDSDAPQRKSVKIR